METQTSDADVDMYDVIFKTIYLFLETNEFHATAESFLNEIKVKYNRQIDTSAASATSAKTLLLRPFFDDSPDTEGATLGATPTIATSASTSLAADGVVVRDVGDASESTSESLQLQLRPQPASGGDVNAACRDCRAIARIRHNLEHCDSGVLGARDLRVLRDSFEMLQVLQDNHAKLIQLAADLSSAISRLADEPRDALLAQYHEQLYELFSYPGTHCSMDIVVVVQQPQPQRQTPPTPQPRDLDDRTECQVESSVINSSNESNRLVSPRLDLYIPLESKQVVGDIPKLIADPRLSGPGDNVSLLNANYRDEPSLSRLSDLSGASASRRSSRADDGAAATAEAAAAEAEAGSASSRGYRLSKSATLPALSATAARTSLAVRSKSRSAASVGCLDERVRDAAQQASGRHQPKHLPRHLSSRRVASAMADGEKAAALPAPSSGRTATQAASSGSARRQVKVSPPPTPAPDYSALIKEKTKLILERQRSRLESEAKLQAGGAPYASQMTLLMAEGRATEREAAPAAARERRIITIPLVMPDVSYLSTTGHSSSVEYDVIRGRARDDDDGARPPLEWAALKRALLDGLPEVKMKLLQALRWRLTDCSAAQRDQHLADYVRNDVLSIGTVPPHGQHFLESFYCPKKTATPHPLQEEMARFINTLASLAAGRAYLEHDESLLSVMLLPLLMGKLPGVKIQDLTREFTMATVQKLSLSNKMREVAIAAGAMEWLVAFVERNHARMTTYEAEYSTALLTNLCINKEARNRCERVADRVVSALDSLIATPHRCCLPYINPILYGLLLNPVINERATARGIGARLRRLYSLYGSDDDLRRQLDAIVQMHEMRHFCDGDDANANADDHNYQSYADYLEHELSLRDPIYHTPIGEELLSVFYVTAAARGDAHRDVINVLTSHRNRQPTAATQHTPTAAVCAKQSPNHLVAEAAAADQRFATKLCKWPPSRAANRERTIVVPSEAARNPRNNANNANVNAANRPAKQAKAPKGRGERLAKLSKRQRSVSQPPAVRRPAVAPKIDTRRENAAQQALHHRAANSKKKPVQYVVNCCYQMDYVNALAAPPGEFLPRALYASTPNLLDAERAPCACYDAMQRGSVEGRAGADRPSGKPTCSAFQVRDIEGEDVRVVNCTDSDEAGGGSVAKPAAGGRSRVKLKLSEYHVVAHEVVGVNGKESAILSIRDTRQ